MPERQPSPRELELLELVQSDQITWTIEEGRAVTRQLVADGEELGLRIDEELNKLVAHGWLAEKEQDSPDDHTWAVTSEGQHVLGAASRQSPAAAPVVEATPEYPVFDMTQLRVCYFKPTLSIRLTNSPFTYKGERYDNTTHVFARSESGEFAVHERATLQESYQPAGPPARNVELPSDKSIWIPYRSKGNFLAAQNTSSGPMTVQTSSGTFDVPPGFYVVQQRIGRETETRPLSPEDFADKLQFNAEVARASRERWTSRRHKGSETPADATDTGLDSAGAPLPSPDTGQEVSL